MGASSRSKTYGIDLELGSLWPRVQHLMLGFLQQIESIVMVEWMETKEKAKIK